ncbi:MAG: sigma-70 family RNA polymerase sigma factor [Rubritalea sp.]|uniref:RNA polymerase sigma factor n=1 Tax=Rubritalea sp. TaxID=2109375 RepID=UPI003241F811
MELDMITTSEQLVEHALKEYESPLIGFAIGLVRDHDRARDVVQDTFIRLYKQDVEKVKGGLKSWLFTVCRNRALDVLRKEKRMVSVDDEILQKEESAMASPDSSADKYERLDEVHRKMVSLSENQQLVIRLKFEQGMSYQEISEQTGLTSSNVGFLLHNGLKKLREILPKDLLN